MGAFLAVAFNYDKIVGSDFDEPSSSIKATIEKPQLDSLSQCLPRFPFQLRVRLKMKKHLITNYELLSG
ncbi:hypothetical protein [Nostoc sp.]|uniref:hypothetical protein n=1 Tax=Nostoc sp. TaxID=1180 RepID=UPI002FF81EBE